MQIDLALAVAQFIFSALIITYLVARLRAGEKNPSRTFTYMENVEESELDRDLPSIDAKIINYLRERGGLAYQSEIGRDLRLPKSTLHRAVMRLETMGVVRVRKMGRRNLVELTGA